MAKLSSSYNHSPQTGPRDGGREPALVLVASLLWADRLGPRCYSTQPLDAPGSRVERSGSRLLGLFASIVVLLLLTSCLDLKVSVAFDTATRGQLTVEALTYRLAQGLRVADGPDKVKFPATRAEWQAVIDQVPGTTLVSWQGADEDLGFRSRTVISFATSFAFEGLFAAFKQKATLRQDFQGKWNMVLTSQIPLLTGGDPETRRLWTTLWGNTVWIFAFTPPNQSVRERRVSLAELAGQAPLEWTLSW